VDIKTYLQEKREAIDSYLKSYFEAPSAPPILYEAMKYSLFAGGKRIRPILAMASYEACGGDSGKIIRQAAALELIHTYSLIHDDLPSMDNDDLRRGKPTNHKVFGEAMAILAGDALLTEAFLMMTNANPPFAINIGPPIAKKGNTNIETPFRKGGVGEFSDTKIKPSALMKSVRDVALSAGANGMVGGQAQDILSENSEPDGDTLEFIHLHKTTALITASVRMGPILAGSKRKKLYALTRYGESVGLAFQIIDDILDIEGTAEELGKPAGSDRKKNKLTYPSLFGIEGARKKAKDLLKKATDSLMIFSAEADPLREIAGYLGVRRA
jgi:geranylgeranyl diphosphate synthase type II